MKKYFIFIVALSCLLVSCSKNDLDYKNHSTYYNGTLKYFISNYNTFFTLEIKENKIRVDDRYTGCRELDSLFKLEPLEYVILGRDHSILFYSHASKGKKPKRVCIVHVKFIQSIGYFEPYIDEPIITEDTDW